MIANLIILGLFSDALDIKSYILKADMVYNIALKRYFLFAANLPHFLSEGGSPSEKPDIAGSLRRGS